MKRTAMRKEVQFIIERLNEIIAHSLAGDKKVSKSIAMKTIPRLLRFKKALKKP